MINDAKQFKNCISQKLVKGMSKLGDSPFVRLEERKMIGEVEKL